LKYVYLPSINFLVPAFTTSFWIKQNTGDNQAGYQGLFTLNDQAKNSVKLSINNSDATYNYFRITIAVQDASAQTFTPSVLKSSVDTANWTHISMVVSGSSLRLYINASRILDTSMNYQFNHRKTYNANFLGYVDTAFVNGYMDEFRLYNRVITNEEVSALYNYTTNASSSVSVSTNNQSWRNVDMRNWLNYSSWQLGDTFGYVDPSYNFNGLVGFTNNQVAGEKKITKINNISYLQRTKKLALTAVGGTDFSYNSGFYTVSPGNTNTTYLKANDFYQADLQNGYTIHAKFSVDSDIRQNPQELVLWTN
jgi:hypothetical protein